MSDKMYFTGFINLLFLASFAKASPGYFQESDTPSASRSSPNVYNGTGLLYSEWSPWTKCSSTCGVGIISRSRTCLKNTYNARGVSVPLCHGDFSEHKVCNLQNCPPNTPAPREVQCVQHNNRIIVGKLVKSWVPADEGPNPCELRCKGQEEGLEYGFGKVSNGTPCPLGVCLDGRCLRIGCDDRLGSEVVADMCGVCGGRNASCVHYKDVYMGQPPADSDHRNGYHEVVVLPVGARNLIIRKMVGKNYLALQDRTRGIIFNGEQHLTQYGGHYDIAGTRVQFEKSDNTTEILTAKAPVTEELYVLVLMRGPNDGIYYEYWLPQQSHNPSRSQFPFRQQDRVTTTTTTTNKPPVLTKPYHHPTKPAFAYGYGEKPYKSKDAPIFRRISTTHRPVYKTTPAAKYNYYPRSSGTYAESYRKDLSALYKPRAYKPAVGYYQMYRNFSADAPITDVSKELPSLQQDSSGNGRGRHENAISNTVLDEKNYDQPKLQKPPRSAIGISKRGDKATNFVQNGRLKYSLESKEVDEVYLNATGHFTASPLAIALLPEDNGTKSGKENKKGQGRRKRPRLGRGGACGPCERNRDQTKHFCESDFVIRALVNGYEFLQGETRYELEVKQTFKNTLSLLPKEYVWSPDTCRCPKLRPGKEYVIMGRIDNNYRKRESRLLVDKTCFVRTFNLKYARRLQKLRKDHNKKCSKTS